MINTANLPLNSKATPTQGLTPGGANKLQLTDFNNLLQDGDFSQLFLKHFSVEEGQLSQQALGLQQLTLMQLPDGNELPPLDAAALLNGDPALPDELAEFGVLPIPAPLIPALGQGSPGLANPRGIAIGEPGQQPMNPNHPRHPGHPLFGEGRNNPGFTPSGLEHYPIDNPGNGRQVLERLMDPAGADIPAVNLAGGDKTGVVALTGAMTDALTGAESVLNAGLNAGRPPAAAQDSGMIKLSIDAPLHQPRWGEAMSGRIAWMLAENHQSAQISLNPPELGPIEVRVSIKNDQANVSFFAHHQDVRDAIEEAFPRLREMLGQNGLNLQEGNVSQHSFAQQQHEHNDAVNRDTLIYDQDNESELGEGPVVTGTAYLTPGYVDHYV